MIKCIGCGELKGVFSFYLQRVGKWEYPSTRCKKCSNIKSGLWSKNHRKELLAKRKILWKTSVKYREACRSSFKKSYRNNLQNHLFKSAEHRAKKRGVFFNIRKEDIIIPSRCPILGIKLFVGTKSNNTHSASVDRVNPKKGYVKGNIKVISMLANRMKNSANKKTLLVFAKNIEEYLK